MDIKVKADKLKEKRMFEEGRYVMLWKYKIALAMKQLGELLSIRL